MSLGTFTSILEAGKSPSDPTMMIAATLVGDGSYPTGGSATFSDTLSAALPRTVAVVAVQGYGVAGGVGYWLVYDASADKLMVINAGTGLEVANATDLSGVTFKATVWAK